MATTARRYYSIPPRLAPWPRDVPFATRAWTFVEASVEVILTELVHVIGFRALLRFVGRTRVRQRTPADNALQLVRLAARDACMCYIRPVQCLQRSSIVTRMLRRRGIAAQLVIGYLPAPQAWHAWVEVDGRVVSDSLYSLHHYHAVDRY